MKRKIVSAPVRWTGSKRKMLNELIDLFDLKKEVYIEPFLGSGIVLLNVLENNIYKEYYVNDVNENLISFYRTLQSDCENLLEEIESLCNVFNSFDDISDKSIYYYTKREEFNSSNLKCHERNAVFWFLMKTGYNGVYRVNSSGCFNVPFGKREKIEYKKDYLIYISNLISNVHFYNEDVLDFFNIIKSLDFESNSFTYLDPPYIPETDSTKNHILYTKSKFSHIDFLEFLETNGFLNYRMALSMSESVLSKQLYQKYFRYNVCFNEYIRKVNPKKKLKSIEMVYLTYESESE